MAFNNTHVITVSRDWHENGKQYWRAFHGTELESGFAMLEGKTRGEVLRDALLIAEEKDAIGPCILAYEHGYRSFRWIDVPYYRATQVIRHR